MQALSASPQNLHPSFLRVSERGSHGLRHKCAHELLETPDGLWDCFCKLLEGRIGTKKQQGWPCLSVRVTARLFPPALPLSMGVKSCHCLSTALRGATLQAQPGGGEGSGPAYAQELTKSLRKTRTDTHFPRCSK